MKLRYGNKKTRHSVPGLVTRGINGGMLIPLRSEAVAELETNRTGLNDELPVAIAVPVLEEAGIVTPVADREASRGGGFIGQVPGIKRGTPVFGNERSCCAQEPERVESFGILRFFADVVFGFALEVRIKRCNKVQIGVNLPAIIHVKAHSIARCAR